MMALPIGEGVVCVPKTSFHPKLMLPVSDFDFQESCRMLCAMCNIEEYK